MPEPATPLSERPWENAARMLGVDEALDAVLAAFAALPAVGLPLLDAAGLVLAADVIARDPVPPFRNSAMDGYAVRAEDTADATWERPVALPVVAQVAAGQGRVSPLPPGAAIRIMTGAPLPEGANAVVRFEETSQGADPACHARSDVLVHRPATALDNVREAGEDIAPGTVVARAGQVLTPPDLGLLASVGRTDVAVHRRPVVAILSTGNEVVAPGHDLARGAIRDSNSTVIGSLARGWGAETRK
jgi:molybdopterin molybdotransferase